MSPVVDSGQQPRAADPITDAPHSDDLTELLDRGSAASAETKERGA